MQLNKLGRTSRGILKAMAAGRSCEQILADDPKLTYHDIFHAASSPPPAIGKRGTPGNRHLDAKAR